MFSRANANDLREQLPHLDQAETSHSNPLFEKYCRHYSLSDLRTTTGTQHRIGKFQCADFSLVAQLFEVPPERCRGTVFLFHGYFDHVGLFGHIIRECLGNEFAVAIFDMPGHGLSSGETASIESFQEYAAALLEFCQQSSVTRLPQPWFAIGQSTGGAVLVDALLHNDLVERVPFEKYVLLCPLLYPVQWGTSKLLYYLARPFVKSTPRNFAKNSHDRKFLEFLKTDDELQSRILPTKWVGAMADYQNRFSAAPSQNTSLRIVQGTDDGTVDWQRNLPLFEQKFTGSKRYLVEGARHHMVNESEEYRSKVFEKTFELILAD